MSELIGSRAEFKRRLLGGSPIMAPFVWDPLTAQLAELAGGEAAYLSGAATAASHGYPDIGLLTQTEMAAAAAAIVRRVRLPVVADADEGYGAAVNVMRTVSEYESAGVCALHIEDQASPKRPNNKLATIIPVADMVKKLRVALHARTDPDLLIIGRTDALAAHGVSEAMARARLYFDLGCDLVFVTGLTEERHRDRYASDLHDIPKVHVSNPPLTQKQLVDYGICLQLHNGTFLPTWTAFLDAVKGILGLAAGEGIGETRTAIARATGLDRYESSLDDAALPMDLDD